jgi:hypothetical protein
VGVRGLTAEASHSRTTGQYRKLGVGTTSTSRAVPALPPCRASCMGDVLVFPVWEGIRGLSNDNFMPFDSDPIFATSCIPAELSCAGSWGHGFA